jgi:hypothetical protein
MKYVLLFCESSRGKLPESCLHFHGVFCKTGNELGKRVSEPVIC